MGSSTATLATSTTTTARPAPQADRLAVVAAVVDAIEAGCETAAVISDAIGMSTRQGSYYLNAAGTLGYLEPVENTSPVAWRLTSLGREFAALPINERAEHLTSVLVINDELATFTASPQGASELASDWAKAGYGAETVSRRLQTIGAWAEFLTADPAEQTNALATASATTRDRAPQAQQRAAAAAAVQAAAAAKAERVTGQMCEGCFIVKPISGSCPTCD